MKKKLFLRLCLIMIALLSLSCRQDVLPEHETYNNSSAFQLTSKRISLSEAKHKAKLLPELDRAEEGIEAFAKKNLHGKTVNYGNGASIDTDDVIYIQSSPNYYTYTFRIKRENAPANAPLENLVLTPLTDGSYRELLISYSLTAQEKQTLMNGGTVDAKGKTTITELTKGTYDNGELVNKTTSWSCGWGYEIQYTICSANEHSHGELPISVEGGTCSATTPSVAILVEVYKCDNIEDPNNPSVGNPVATGPGYAGNPGSPAIEQPGTPSDCTNPTVLTGPQNPSTGTGDGGCVGVPTFPNLPSTHDPCWNIKTNFANAKFKEKVAAIDKPEVSDYDHEMGYAAGYPPANTSVVGTQYPPMENTLGTHNVTLPTGTQYFGFMHSHTNREGAIKMFSPGDLATFLTSCVVNANQSGSIGDAYSMVITSQGNYILKYTGFSTNFGYTTTTKASWMEWYLTQLKKIQNDDNTFDQNKLEKLFLRFLKEKVNINGIQLYKVDKITGKANELNLDTNNNVIPTPCD